MSVVDDRLARERGWKYAAQFPRMWEVPGEKCLHEQTRTGLITLKCARPKGHALGYNNQRHLHDVPPEFQS